MLPLTAEDVYAHGLRIIHYDWLTSEQNVYRKARQEVIETHGSNGWAIGPSKSATGNAMLMSNSHLPWSDNDTYFEVQLTAPGVTSYGAVWVGFPVLRQCFTEFVAWTQTTNGPTGADVYRLTLAGDGYVLDGKTRAFEVEPQVIKVRQPDGIVERRAAHDPPHRARAGVLRPPRCHGGAARLARRSAEDVRAVLAHGAGEELRRVAHRDAHAAAADLPHDVRRSRRPHHVRLQRRAAGARRTAITRSGTA